MGAESFRHQYSEPACCRNCGKPRGAIMSCGAWGHNYQVCSEACGIRLGHKIEHGMGGPKFGDPPDGLQAMILAEWMGEPHGVDERILNLRIRIKQLERLSY